ncbi:MAG: glycerol kinase, partial [Selenomonadaceae bacterium]|nr:glycerol kinase [Selenomonadaceae bacterium]
MQEKYILALDSGTVKNRAVIFNRAGDMVSYAEKRISVNRPHSGWVEQDPDEIWSTQLWAAKEAIRLARLSNSDIAAIGI